MWPKVLLEDVLFFSLSVGYTMPWTALSSELGYLKSLHGANVLLFLNIAYFAPSLPILVTQLVLDPRFNKKYGAAKAALFRQCVALPICFLCSIILPYLSWTSLPTLIIISAVIGTAASIAFGSSSQLVARFPPSCGQALALGIVSSGPLVLLLQFLLSLGPHPTALKQIMFFHIASLFPLVSLACIIRLLRRYWTPLQAGNVLLPFSRVVQAATNTNTNAIASPALTRPHSNNNLTASNANITNVSGPNVFVQTLTTVNVRENAQQPQPQLAPSAPSAPVIPSTSFQEEDSESCILGNLSDMDFETQDSFPSFDPVSHQVASLPAVTSAAPLVDNINAPLLESHPVPNSIAEDSLHPPLLSVGALPDLHITLPDITQHPLLAAAPIAVDVPWSPTASVPGGGNVQSTSFLEGLGTRAGGQADADPARGVFVNNQYVNDFAETSSFWLTNVGTPREGAIIFGTPQESAITAPLLGESLRGSLRGSLHGSLAPSVIGTVDSGWPHVPPVPPQQLQPQRTSIAGTVFTVVRSSGALGCMLPQALFAARMVSDILGRVLASAGQPPVSMVGTVATMKAAMLPMALLYLWAPPEFLSDVASLLFVMVHWILSGLVGAWSFMLLPNFFAGPESAAYAGTVMSAAYQGGTIAGLVLATLVEYVFAPPTTHLTPLIC